MKKILSSIFILLLAAPIIAQKVGIGTTTPDPSAALDVTSTTQGMLVPRMTTAQRTAISNAANGLLVFDVTTNSFWFKGNSSWVQLIDSAQTEVHRVPGNKLYMGMNDTVGIGTNNPQIKLQVKTATESYGISHTDGQVNVTTYTGQNAGWIGTKSDHPFKLFADDGYDQFVLSQAGNVGINLTAPLNKLDVAGTWRTGTHPTNLPMYVTGNIGASSSGVEIRHTNGTQGIGIGFNTIYAAGSESNQDLNLASKGSYGSLNFSTNNSTRMSINAYGNVGIGTNPITTLDIARGTAPAGTLNVRGSEYSSNFYSGDGQSITLRGGVEDANIYLNDAEELGNVLIGTKLGIGTYNPNRTLSVANKFGVDANGSIHFNNVPRQIYFYEDELPDKMILSHSPAYPTWGLQYAVNTFRFLADSASVMDVDLGLNRVRVAGSLGVGITPTNSLDIHAGSARTGTHPTGLTMYATGDILAASSGFEIRHNNGSQGVGIGFNTIYATGSNNDQDIGLKSRGPGGSILFSTNTTEKMRITGAGNIGIGTISPNAPLQFANSVQNRKIVLYEVANNDHQYYGFGINSNMLRYQVAGTTDYHAFYAGSNASSSNELMRITGSGSVGIGTSAPNQKFSVANKFGVDANGSLHFSNTARQMYFYEDGLASKMILSHSPSFPAWGLQYTSGNKFRFLKDSTQVMAVDLGENAVEVNGTLKIGYHIVENGPVDVPPLSVSNLTCNCPPGEVVLGGGYWSNYANGCEVGANQPSGTTSWHVAFYNKEVFTTHQLKVYAICARLGN